MGCRNRRHVLEWEGQESDWRKWKQSIKWNPKKKYQPVRGKKDSLSKDSAKAVTGSAKDDTSKTEEKKNEGDNPNEVKLAEGGEDSKAEGKGSAKDGDASKEEDKKSEGGGSKPGSAADNDIEDPYDPTDIPPHERPFDPADVPPPQFISDPLVRKLVRYQHLICDESLGVGTGCLVGRENAPIPGSQLAYTNPDKFNGASDKYAGTVAWGNLISNAAAAGAQPNRDSPEGQISHAQQCLGILQQTPTPWYLLPERYRLQEYHIRTIEKVRAEMETDGEEGVAPGTGAGGGIPGKKDSAASAIGPPGGSGQGVGGSKSGIGGNIAYSVAMANGAIAGQHAVTEAANNGAVDSDDSDAISEDSDDDSESDGGSDGVGGAGGIDSRMSHLWPSSVGTGLGKDHEDIFHRPGERSHGSVVGQAVGASSRWSGHASHAGHGISPTSKSGNRDMHSRDMESRTGGLHQGETIIRSGSNSPNTRAHGYNSNLGQNQRNLTANLNLFYGTGAGAYCDRNQTLQNATNAAASTTGATATVLQNADAWFPLCSGDQTYCFMPLPEYNTWKSTEKASDGGACGTAGAGPTRYLHMRNAYSGKRQRIEIPVKHSFFDIRFPGNPTRQRHQKLDMLREDDRRRINEIVANSRERFGKQVNTGTCDEDDIMNLMIDGVPGVPGKNSSATAAGGGGGADNAGTSSSSTAGNSKTGTGVGNKKSGGYGQAGKSDNHDSEADGNPPTKLGSKEKIAEELKALEDSRKKKLAAAFRPNSAPNGAARMVKTSSAKAET